MKPETADGDRERALSRKPIDRDFRRLRVDLRSSATLRGLSLTVLLLAALVLFSLGVDRLFRLSMTARGVAAALYACLALWAAWRFVVRPLFAGLPDALLADLLERRFPVLDDTLRSAIDFLRTPGLFAPLDPRSTGEGPHLSLLMKREVTRQAIGRLRDLDCAGVIHPPAIAWSFARALLAAGVILAFSSLFPNGFKTWFQRNVLLRDVEWPYRTHLIVEGFPDRERGVPRGDPLEIRVRAEGEDPLRVSIRLRYESDSSRYNLPREGSTSTFVYHHPAVTEKFSFVVEGGDYRSKPYAVLPLERPRVEEIQVTLEPPAYTERDPIVADTELGELAAPEGSTLSLRGRANKPLERAWLEAEKNRIELFVSGHEFRGSYLPKSGGVVTVNIEDVERVPPDSLLQFRVHLLPDRLPTVQVKANGLGPMISAVARMPLEIQAKDDYKVEKLGLEWTLIDENGVRKIGEDALPGPEKAGDRVRENANWEVGSLEIQPEKRLSIRVGATDNDALAESGPKTGYSGTLSFLVVTVERLGEEFIRREAEQRRVLEALLANEKKVRDSVYTLLTETWRLEGKLSKEVVDEMLALARTERQHGRQAVAVASAVQQILTELENNRVGEAEDLARLGELIIRPLTDLGEGSMPGAAVELRGIRDADGAEKRVDQGLELASRLERHISTLEDVISNMLRLESFTEIVKHLRVIMKTQEESRKAAQVHLEKDIDALFEQ